MCEHTDLFVVCERYALLPNDKRQMIAGELDRSVREIERKISVGLPALTCVLADAECYQS